MRVCASVCACVCGVQVCACVYGVRVCTYVYGVHVHAPVCVPVCACVCTPVCVVCAGLRTHQGPFLSEGSP